MLAFACAFTMFAGAAFTDAADINADNVEAVDLLTTLGIIQGYEDGSFDPEGTVTRAEMAKMIYTIRNDGNDDASAYETVTTTFQDVSGHWAEGYIKYLQNTGIVAGKSATQFDPDSQVTTGEAMKMALALGGYDEEHAGLTGISWLNNTVSLATTNGLTDDVASAIAGGCTRQDAAQILANVLSMTAVRWSSVVEDFVNDSEEGLSFSGDAISVGRKWMDLWTNIGTLVEIDGHDLTIQMSSSDEADSDLKTDDADNEIGFTSLDTDYTDLLGQKVKILFNDGKVNSVIGVFATSDNTVYTANASDVDVDGNDLKIDGTAYRLDDTDTLTVYSANLDGDPITGFDGNAVDIDNFDNLDQDLYKITFVDNDADGRLNVAIVTEYDAAEVTYVSSTRLVADGSYDFDDENIDEDLASGDWIMKSYDRYDQCLNINAAETLDAVELAETATDSNDNGRFDQFLMEDNWYNEWNGDNADVSAAVRAGDTVDAVIVNGVVVKLARSVSGGERVEDAALVLETGDTFDGDRVKMVSFNGDDRIVDFSDNGDIEDRTDLDVGTVYGINEGASSTSFDNLELNEDDYYNGFTAFKGDLNYNAANNEGGDRIGRYVIDNSAEVLVYEINGDEADFVSMTGRQFKNLTRAQKGTLEINNVTAFYGDVDGLTRIAALAIESDDISGMDNSTTSNYYGVITSNVRSTSNNRLTYTLWTEDGERNVVEDIRTAGLRAKGVVIGYDELTQNDDETWTIDGVTVQAADDGVTGIVVGAVTEVNSAEDTVRMVRNADYSYDSDYAAGLVTTDEYDLTSDTTVLFVDSQSGDFTGIPVDDVDDPSEWNLQDEYANAVALIIAGDIEWILHDVSGELDAPYIVATSNDTALVNPVEGIRNVVADTSITRVNETVDKGTELTLRANVWANYSVDVVLTGAYFKDTESNTMRVNGTAANPDLNEVIVVDGTADEVTVTFEQQNVQVGNVTPVNIAAGTDVYATYSFVASVDNNAMTDNQFVEVSKTVNVDVTANAAPQGGSNTITVTFGDASQQVTFNAGNSNELTKRVSFVVDASMQGADITCTSTNTPAQAAKVTSVQLLTANGLNATTMNSNSPNTDATQIRITFDRPMNPAADAFSATSGREFVVASTNNPGSWLSGNGVWSDNNTVITFTLGTEVTNASNVNVKTAAITFGADVVTAEGAAIDATTGQITITTTVTADSRTVTAVIGSTGA